MAPQSQHARTGPAEISLPEPTHAERVRTLASVLSTGTLSTLSRRQPGFPFGSLMPFAPDAAGNPLFLISGMAMHTQNLKADGRASLFLAASGDGDPLGAARATLVGRVEPVLPAVLPPVRELYLLRHPNSRNWVDYGDFGFFQLTVQDIYYVGGFGVMGWAPADEYAVAAPDPLAAHAAAILDHMNRDHVEAMVLLARVHGGVEASAAAMTSVDRLGFTLRLTTEDGMRGVRINFPHEVATPTETREALVAMVAEARSRSSSR